MIIMELRCPHLSRPGRKVQLDTTQFAEAIGNRVEQAWPNVPFAHPSEVSWGWRSEARPARTPWAGLAGTGTDMEGFAV